MPRRGRHSLDFGALSDVLRRGSVDPSTLERPAGGASRLLRFDDRAMERAFVDAVVTSPSTVRLIRMYCFLCALGHVAFSVMDSQLEAPLGPALMMARAPSIAWTLVVGYIIVFPRLKPYILPLSFATLLVWSVSMGAVHLLLALIAVESSADRTVHERNATFVHAHSLMQICSFSMVVLGIRIPLRVAVPAVASMTLALALAVAAPLGNLGIDHLFVALATVFVSMSVITFAQRGVELAARREFAAIKAVEAESRSTTAAKRLSSTLLLNVLPYSIAQRLESGQDTIADQYPRVSVAFVSIESIRTPKGQPLRGLVLARQLNAVFAALEDVCDEVGVEKVKTTSRLFMAISGAPYELDEHADAIVAFCLQALRALDDFGQSANLVVEARAGADSGPVLCGVIGTTRVTWDCWGDIVNMASRMCGSAPLGGIQISESTNMRLGDNGIQTEARGVRNIKGKGMVHTFLVHDSGQLPGSLMAIQAAAALSDHSSLQDRSRGSFMTHTSPTSTVSLTPEERREISALLNTPVDKQFGKNGRFQEPELEVEYSEARHAWMAENGPACITVMICVGLLVLVALGPLTIGEDGGLVWAALRIAGLTGLAWMRVRVTRQPYSSLAVAGCLAVASSLSNVVARADILYNPGMVEFFLVSFTNIVMSGLRLRHSVPPVLVALVGAAMAEDEEGNGIGLVLLPLVATLFALIGARSLDRGLRRGFVQQKRVNAQHTLLLKQFKRTKEVLGRVLPPPVITRIQEGLRAGAGMSLYDELEEVTVFAMDIVGFTSISTGKSPTMIVLWLNNLFSVLDDKAAKHGLDKIKTIGDAYICASGVHTAHKDGPSAVVRFALEVIDEVSKMPQLGTEPVRVRIGVGTGPALGGLMGKASKLAYDLFGDAIQVAERMEETGQPGRAQLCSVTARAISRLPDADVVVDTVTGASLTTSHFARWRDGSPASDSATA